MPRVMDRPPANHVGPPPINNSTLIVLTSLVLNFQISENSLNICSLSLFLSSTFCSLYIFLSLSLLLPLSPYINYSTELPAVQFNYYLLNFLLVANSRSPPNGRLLHYSC